MASFSIAAMSRPLSSPLPAAAPPHPRPGRPPPRPDLPTALPCPAPGLRATVLWPLTAALHWPRSSPSLVVAQPRTRPGRPLQPDLPAARSPTPRPASVPLCRSPSPPCRTSPGPAPLASIACAPRRRNARSVPPRPQPPDSSRARHRAACSAARYPRALSSSYAPLT